jgi:hypothetical protein
VINISNYTGEDNTPRLARATWPSGSGTSAGASRTTATRSVSPGRALGDSLRVLLSWLAAIPRRLGDRLFAMNDAEASWRNWQVTKTHGGLGRRYRDPAFDTLAECPRCRGAGVTVDLPCLPCLGTGRVTREEVS